jgi:hypothetical protein
LNVKDNKIIQLPNCFDALRQKVNVEYDGQSSYKEREPRNRERPVKSATELDVSAATEGSGNKSPSGAKSRKNKKSPRNKGAKPLSGEKKRATAVDKSSTELDLTPTDGFVQPTFTSGDISETTLETEHTAVSPSGEGENQQDDEIVDEYKQLSVDGDLIFATEKAATM